MKIVGGVFSGAIGGLGVVVLLQQYAVAYPTALVTLAGLVLGVGAHFGIVALAGAGAPTVAGAPIVAGRTGDDPPAAPIAAGIADHPWAPTHLVPEDGLGAWAEPDAAQEAIAHLDPALGVRVDERRGDWARVVCENGWTAWVDGRPLIAVAP